MTQRIHPGICLLLLLPMALPSSMFAAPPRNVNEFALAYRVQVYETFRDNRSEYNRRVEAGKRAMVRYRMAKNSLDRNRVIDWYSQAIVASYPGASSDLPILPQNNVANTFQDADAIAGRGSEFKYNPEFHPLRFNQYSRSSDWETQKPTMPSFDEDEQAPSQSLADNSNNVQDNSDLELDVDGKPPEETSDELTTEGDQSDEEQLALGSPTPDVPAPLDATDARTLESSDTETATAAMPDRGALDIALSDPQSDDDDPQTDDDDEAEATPDIVENDVESPDSETVVEENDPTINDYAELTNEDNLEDVQAEVDASNAAEAFDTVVSSEVAQDTVPKFLPIEINARVAGHNLALAGLEKRTQRAFSGNYKDIANVVERMEQLFDAHIKARLMIDSAPELQTQLIALDNIVHLTSEVNRQLQQFLHSKTEDMDRATLESLRLRADAIYQSAEGL